MLHLRLHSSVFGIVQALRLERSWYDVFIMPHVRSEPDYPYLGD